jgi:hypothetical protein
MQMENKLPRVAVEHLQDWERPGVSTGAFGPSKAWLRSVEPHKDPRALCSAISLDDSESSYFNNYVAVDATGTYRVYIELDNG